MWIESSVSDNGWGVCDVSFNGNGCEFGATRVALQQLVGIEIEVAVAAVLTIIGNGLCGPPTGGVITTIKIEGNEIIEPQLRGIITTIDRYYAATVAPAIEKGIGDKFRVVCGLYCPPNVDTISSIGDIVCGHREALLCPATQGIGNDCKPPVRGLVLLQVIYLCLFSFLGFFAVLYHL